MGIEVVRLSRLADEFAEWLQLIKIQALGYETVINFWIDCFIDKVFRAQGVNVDSDIIRFLDFFKIALSDF